MHVAFEPNMQSFRAGTSRMLLQSIGTMGRGNSLGNVDDEAGGRKTSLALLPVHVMEIDQEPEPELESEEENEEMRKEDLVDWREFFRKRPITTRKPLLNALEPLTQVKITLQSLLPEESQSFSIFGNGNSNVPVIVALSATKGLLYKRFELRLFRTHRLGQYLGRIRDLTNRHEKHEMVVEDDSGNIVARVGDSKEESQCLGLGTRRVLTVHSKGCEYVYKLYTQREFSFGVGMSSNKIVDVSSGRKVSNVVKTSYFSRINRTMEFPSALNHRENNRTTEEPSQGCGYGKLGLIAAMILLIRIKLEQWEQKKYGKHHEGHLYSSSFFSSCLSMVCSAAHGEAKHGRVASPTSKRRASRKQY